MWIARNKDRNTRFIVVRKIAYIHFDYFIDLVKNFERSSTEKMCFLAIREINPLHLLLIPFIGKRMGILVITYRKYLWHVFGRGLLMSIHVYRPMSWVGGIWRRGPLMSIHAYWPSSWVGGENPLDPDTSIWRESSD